MPADERLLGRYTDSPQGPDYYSGPQLKGPEPGLLEKLIRNFAKDPNQAVPFPPAIALNEANLPLFTKAMQEAPSLTNNPLIDKVIAFLKTRYPRFTSQAPVTAIPDTLSPYTLGRFSAYVEPSGGISTEVKINPSPAFERSFSDIIETLAHEMTHARQFAKGGVEALGGEAAAGVPYENRIIEKLARQGGSTARENVSKYLELKNPEGMTLKELQDFMRGNIK